MIRKLTGLLAGLGVLAMLSVGAAGPAAAQGKNSSLFRSACTCPAQRGSGFDTYRRPFPMPPTLSKAQLAAYGTSGPEQFL